MARTGGNPGLKKYRFKQKGDLPLIKKLSVSMDEKMYEDVLQKGGGEYVRKSIETNNLIEEICDRHGYSFEEFLNEIQKRELAVA